MDKARELGLNGTGAIPRGQERISQEIYRRSVIDVRLIFATRPEVVDIQQLDWTNGKIRLSGDIKYVFI